MHYSFEFDEFDNPKHLSKVGNWVITFLTSSEQSNLTQLAITNVIPRQATNQLQARRVVIQQELENSYWKILQLDCFDGKNNKDIQIELSEQLAQDIFQQAIEEFAKYDVNLTLHSTINTN